jgi:hypothetical protein
MSDQRLSYYEELIRALQIFKEYDSDEFMSAEHDEIHAGPNPELVSAEHIAELEELGWHPSEWNSFYHFV